jgi:hypothetical protein
LDERTAELLNSAEFKMNINQIRLFYDIFEQSSKPKLKSEEAGIIGVDLELLPESDFNFPLEMLFKLFHATEQCQLVKYNPPFQDAILRMYTKNQTKGGKKIPYLLIQYQSDSNKIYDIQQISKKMATFANMKKQKKQQQRQQQQQQHHSNTRVSIYIIYDKLERQYGIRNSEKIAFICEFDELGHIFIHATFKNAYAEDAIDEMIRAAVSPHLRLVIDFLNQNGYKMRDFYSMYDDNVVIQNMEYLLISKLNNTEPLVWSRFYGCMSSVMKVTENNWNSEEKGVSMQYVRVPNFDEGVMRLAYIESLYNMGFREKKQVVGLLVKNLLVTKRVAEQSYDEFKTNFEGKYSKVLQKKQMPKKIYVRKFPGFKTHMIKGLGDAKNKITIKITGINNIYTLNPIRIYIDSLLHIFGNDEKYMPAQLVKQLCDISSSSSSSSSSVSKAAIVAATEKKEEVEVARKVDEKKEEVEVIADEKKEEEAVIAAEKKVEEEEATRKATEEEEEPAIKAVEEPAIKATEEPAIKALKEEAAIKEAAAVEEEEEEDIGNFDLLGGDGEEEDIDLLDNEEEEDEEDDNEYFGGAFESNPVYKRLKNMEPSLFKETAGYATKCGWSARRQPIILTKEELDKINTYDEKIGQPSYYGVPLEYSSENNEDDPELEGQNKHYYICPRYWNVPEERSVSQKEIDEKKLHKNIVTKEDAYNPDNKEKFIIDLTSPLEHFKTGKYTPYLPGFLKTLKTKSGKCLPCCFTGIKGKDSDDLKDYHLFDKEEGVIEECKKGKVKTTAPPALPVKAKMQTAQTQSEKVEQLESASNVEEVEKVEEEPAKQKKKKSKTNLYVSKPDSAFPLQQNNLGFLPLSLQLFLFEDENYSRKCKSTKGDMLVEDEICVLRMGVLENKDSNYNQCFISCIANVYNSLSNQSLSATEFKHQVLIPRLSLDRFASYQNGTLVETFKKFKYIDKDHLLKYRDTRLFKQIFPNDDFGNEGDDDEDKRVVFFKTLIMSFENFIHYLSNDDVAIDYTYLWDYITDSVLWSEYKKGEQQEKRQPPIYEEGLNLIILELTDNKDEVSIICPTNHYSNSTFESRRVNVIIVKYEGYYEPLYTYLYTSKRDIVSTVLFSSVNSSKMDKTLKTALKKIQTFFESTCKPAQLVKSIVQNKPFDEIVQILKSKATPSAQIRDEDIKQIVDFSGKTIGMQITFNIMYNEKMRSITGNILCNPSAINRRFEMLFVNQTPTIWKTYKHTKEFALLVHKKSKGDLPCAFKLKVVENERVIGFMTETNQFMPISDPVPFKNDGDNLKHVEFGNSVNIDMSLIPQMNRSGFVFKRDEERINDVEKIRLETNFYNAFRNIIRIQLNGFENMEVRNSIEALIYNRRRADGQKNNIQQQYNAYIKKLAEMKKMLIALGRRHIQFAEMDPSVLKTIYEQKSALSCVTERGSSCKKLAYCFSIDDAAVCGLYIPKRNLVDDSDNENNYYIRLADELLRYRRIRAYMLHPNKYLTFDSISYNLKDNEMLLLDADVLNYISENKRVTIPAKARNL